MGADRLDSFPHSVLGDVLPLAPLICTTRDVVRDVVAWPDPTPEMLSDPLFEAIWQVIKTWDIAVPRAYGGYCGASGNHVRAILDTLYAAPAGPRGRDDG